jgi:hypothetical protein
MSKPWTAAWVGAIRARAGRKVEVFMVENVVWG